MRIAAVHQGLTPSSTSQLILSRFWSLKPQQATNSQLNLRPFAGATSEHRAKQVLTLSRKVDVCSPKKMLTLR
jgi:hypothetical protein